MIKRALLIVNPGARKAERAGLKALHAFAHESVPCEVIFTEAAGHATEIARERGSKADAVFTLGGDGTAMEVITALADQPDGPPVGILPGGTGNILVRSLGIPFGIARAVHALLAGQEARIDLGRTQDGRHFAIGLGVGIDEAMIAGASPLMKKRLGVLAYVWSATKAALHPETFHVRLTVDDVVYEREAAFVMLANLGTVPLFGAVARFGDGILYDDGLLHACIYSPKSVGDSVRIFTNIMRGRTDPAAFYIPGTRFRLETTPPRRAQADGELLDVTPIEVTVRPHAARLLIPKRR